jgi:hypothetical protein
MSEETINREPAPDAGSPTPVDRGTVLASAGFGP